MVVAQLLAAIETHRPSLAIQRWALRIPNFASHSARRSLSVRGAGGQSAVKVGPRAALANISAIAA